MLGDAVPTNLQGPDLPSLDLAGAPYYLPAKGGDGKQSKVFCSTVSRSFPGGQCCILGDAH